MSDAEDESEGDVEVGRRVRIARLQAGYKTRKALTNEMRLRRFGDATLGKVERGKRDLQPHEAEALGAVLKLDAMSFFEEAQTETQLAHIERMLQAIMAHHGLTLRPLEDDVSREPPGRVAPRAQGSRPTTEDPDQEDRPAAEGPR